uniref:Uncharacterized protein n=1 Tax=Rhizophora mucronata TaxID=61149 RepID=A0A2P2PHL3_RHIMU
MALALARFEAYSTPSIHQERLPNQCSSVHQQQYLRIPL